MADAFAKTLGALENKLFQIIDRGIVTKNELSQFAFIAPSDISSKSIERSLYQDLLMGNEHLSQSRPLSRRLTLLLVLRIAKMLGKEPSADEVRWILYAGSNAAGTPLQGLPPELEQQRQRWRVYQANDLCHVALEALLKFVLDTLGNHPNGILPAVLVTQCVSEILEEADTKSASWTEFLATRQLPKNAYSSKNADSEWSLSREIIRGAGRSDKQVCAPEIAWKAINLLAILCLRVQADPTVMAHELGQFDKRGPGFRSLLTETRFLESHKSTSFGELVRRLLEERIIRRHLWVALGKFRAQRDYTFLIEMDDGRLRLRDKDGPVLTTPRLSPAIAFLRDINLIGDKGLTPAGAAVVGAT